MSPVGCVHGLFTNFHAQDIKPVMFGETCRHFATCVREHLTTDRASHAFKHLESSPQCRSLCSFDSFKILDNASASFQLKIKEAIYIKLEKQPNNAQVKHVNLKLSL